MKCATVTIGGSETSIARFKALPEMFRANSENDCEVPEEVEAIKFKNPGPYVVGSGITTIDCSTQLANISEFTPAQPISKFTAPAASQHDHRRDFRLPKSAKYAKKPHKN
ncbi:hypothetical protein RUND412_000167 [Rhizina undulata]